MFGNSCRKPTKKIEKINEFELAWMFFDAVDPCVRAELGSKNIKTLDDALTQAWIFSRKRNKLIEENW
ncbi:hypothetical protein BpHYR1_005839 [Brachionus plicatilis]|uniref:Uncharacterized protein n=1 Tax=Brachionus plicatilis TaxID=10195 RepID=A0A3M7RUT4_BRAPC|nr:hypothetical protein BpHYR1_005839 [Brachionus plicatilis]